MNFTSEQLTLIGTLSGTFIGALFGFLTAWITKRSEERKSFKELTLKIASERFSIEINAALKNQGGGVVFPYQVYVIETLQIARLINKRFLTEKRLHRLLEEMHKITDVAAEFAKSRSAPSQSK